MTSPFTEEHELFRKQVRTFCEKELAPHADAWEHDELFPSWVFKRAGELGILGAHYPEDVGGGGGDYWFSIAKSEELVRIGSAGVGMGLLVQSDMATPCIAELGTKEQKDEFLVPALKGEKIAALGVSEPGAGSDVQGIRTTAKRDGDDYVINGSKTYITNGTRADFVTLLAKTGEGGAHGISIFLVPTATKGFGISKKLSKMGNWASDTAELFFDNVRVPKRYLLGEENMGFVYLMQNFQSERLIACTSAVAGTRRALDRSVNEWGRERQVFGKPLIKQQVWQHKFVDLYTKVEAAQALAYKAAHAFNTDRYVNQGDISFDTTKLIAMGKIFVGDVATEVADQVVQFHGGMGYLEELWVARYYRDQRLFRIGGGTSEVMKHYTARLMGF